MTKGKRKSQDGKSAAQQHDENSPESLATESLEQPEPGSPAEEAQEMAIDGLKESLEEVDQEKIELRDTDEPHGEIQELPSIEELQDELESLRKEAEEYLDGWQRALAEFSNFKKRVEREQEEARARITGDILIRYLDILDDFERALKDQPEGEQHESWLTGIDLIYQKLKLILDAEGVEPISSEGDKFNPNIHEAISYEDSDDHSDGQVIEVVKKGYVLGERVIRPALVRVAK